jgi:hypothetical protein
MQVCWHLHLCQLWTQPPGAVWIPGPAWLFTFLKIALLKYNWQSVSHISCVQFKVWHRYPSIKTSALFKTKNIFQHPTKFPCAYFIIPLPVPFHPQVSLPIFYFSDISLCEFAFSKVLCKQNHIVCAVFVWCDISSGGFSEFIECINGTFPFYC